MYDVITRLGGPSKVARMLGIKPPSVIGWGGRVPPDRCPAIERATGGEVTCEQLRPDVRWVRVRDPSWPHPEGRPCIDVAARAELAEETCNALRRPGSAVDPARHAGDGGPPRVAVHA
ncbi:transcriptional regulator [Calidifontimicrobium sp. SYSU G02091]|uniref:transcriptional regulator n=1 Tax=Calidifontimicrobium sp. SYSU G02091 TaxID=2926421 RepID=UPI003014B1A7